MKYELIHDIKEVNFREEDDIFDYFLQEPLNTTKKPKNSAINKLKMYQIVISCLTMT